MCVQEAAELVHRVHLLCLIARGRIIDNACNDPLLQVWFTSSVFFFSSLFSRRFNIQFSAFDVCLF